MNLSRTAKNTLSTGIPFAIGMGLFFALQRGLLAGLILGSISGLLFGLALSAFIEVQRRRMKLDQLDGEPVVHQGPANHWLGAEARGGWLVLTKSRLVFRSHGKNIQNQGAEIQLADVVACEPRNTLGLVPNGMSVRHRDDKIEKFVLTGRGEWLAALKSVLPQTSS